MSILIYFFVLKIKLFYMVLIIYFINKTSLIDLLLGYLYVYNYIMYKHMFNFFILLCR